ncbi:MAG: flagellar basal body rod protein FlgB [Lachnospiraceae bacterium]|nr:flagellar basal body rod protein FlgB [Lachnospiraceae bacterium]
MIKTDAFNYVNVLQKAADASWYRNDVLANNLANVDTPNYKRKDVQFETYLITSLTGGDSLDSNIANADLDELQPTTYVDQSNLSYRLDGNNVDINTESAELAKNQLRYYTLLDSMSQEFERLKTAMSKT